MSNEFFALDAGDGKPIWYLQMLMTIKASGDQTGGVLGLIEVECPPGMSPLHVHHHDDEAFYLLEGRVTYTCGDQQFEGGPGSFIWLPRDIPHRLRFETYCKLLQFCLPAGLEVFHEQMGRAAERRELPPPGEVLDVERYKTLAKEYGIEIMAVPAWDKKAP